MQSTRIRVAIAGAAGKMGREAVATLTADDRFEVVAVLVRQSGQALLSTDVNCPVYTNARLLLTEVRPDVWIDFTDASSVSSHIDECLVHGVRPVIGATGYGDADLLRWDALAKEQNIGAIAAPNFALGALLMIRFAKEAARLFPQVEIIELHHDGKKDAPSGTAKRTAAAIAAERRESAPSLQSVDNHQQGGPDLRLSGNDNGARGYEVDGIHIHSVRLPGLVAHQEVILGSTGETLTIRHDSLSRTSFMQGLLIACERVMDVQGLVYGLENLLW